MEGILDKEKNKERRERVAYVLIQKLTFKFGSRFANIVTFFVEEYFNSHEEISSGEIASLEAEIRKAIKATIEANKSNRPETDSNKIESEKQAAEAAAAAAKVLKFLFHLPVESNMLTHILLQAKQDEADARRPLTGHEWQMIQIYQSIQDQDKIQRERELDRQKKMKFRMALDGQRNHSNQQNSAELEDERKYVEHIMHDIESYHTEEQRKREATRKKYEEELQARKRQIEDQQRRLLEEKTQLRQMERANLDMADNEIKRDMDAAQRARLNAKEKMERIKKENEENKRLRQLEKEKEAEEDYRLMQEYAAKLDREAKEREEAFANRMKTMEKFGQKFANEGAGKALREEQLRFEQQLLREQQKKAADDERKELLKEEERRKRLQAQMNENKRQLEVRKSQREEEKRQDQEMADHYRHEVDAYNREREEKMNKYRKSQLEYRRRLDQQQMDWKRVSQNLDDITLTEKQINHEILDDLANPQTMSKVLHRVRMSSARAKSAK